MAEYEQQRASIDSNAAYVVDAARTAHFSAGSGGRKPTGVSIKVDPEDSVLRLDSSSPFVDPRPSPPSAQASRGPALRRTAGGMEGAIATTTFELHVFKGEMADKLADIEATLKTHEQHHEVAGETHNIAMENRRTGLERHGEVTESIAETEKRMRSLMFSQGQELQASIQEQAAHIAYIQERFEDELRQKMDKSLGQLRQVQDMVYKMESLDERMNSLETQFRERVNTLAQMHGARLERVEGLDRPGFESVPAIDEHRDAMDQKIAVVEKQRLEVLRRLEDLELNVQSQRLVPRSLWHKVEQEGYSSLSSLEKTTEELSRLTSDAEEDPQASVKLLEPLPEDSWGASVLLICKELPDLCSKDGDRMSCILMVALPCICSLSVFLQFVLIQFLNSYIIAPAVEDVHQTYCVGEGNGTSNFVAPVTTTWFMCVALWLWVMQLIGEVRNCFALSTAVYKCPHVRTRGDMALIRYIDDSAKQDDYHGDVNGVRIAGLTHCARCILLVITTIPRIILVAWVGWIGCTWLAASLHYTDLLLHIVGLQLILHIDTAVYSACVPDSYRAKIKKSSIERPESVGETIVTASRESMLKKMLVTIVLVCLCIGYVFVFRNYFVTQHISPSSCS